MVKRLGKISVLTMISALFVFAFAGTAFAEETDGELPAQLVEIEEQELPVGGWAPAEAIRVPEDFMVNDADDPDGMKSSKRKINADPNSVFTRGAASTGYNALNSAQKQLYNALNEEVIAFMDAESDLEPSPTKINGEIVDCYIVGTVKYSQLGITDVQEALKVYYAYDYDHPAYYWLSNQVLYNSSVLSLCTEEEYAGVSARRTINALVSSSVKAYADIAENGSDTMDQAALVHDKIVDTINYAHESDGSTPVSAKWAHSVHGVFDPEYKAAVCEGYADAFALIMNYMGISNYYIIGTASAEGTGGGGGHAWNAVCDENTGKYFYLDLTWDDIDEEHGYSYKYFGMPKTDFEQSHFKFVPGAETAQNWLYATNGDYCDSFGETYYNKGGFYYDGSVNADHFVAAAEAKAARSGGWVSVLCPDFEKLGTIAGKLNGSDGYLPTSYKGTKYYITTAPLNVDHTHSWSEPTYTWASDNSQVTAARVCEAPNCHVMAQAETVNTTFEGTEPTCTEAGQGTYTAAFSNAAFSTQTKQTTIDALGHDWGRATYTWASDYSEVTANRVCNRGCTATETVEPVFDVTKAATCTKAGQGTYTATFKNPAFSVQTKTKTIKALGHVWSAPKYQWSDDNSTVTATRACSRQTEAGCTVTETASATSTVTKKATCTEAGRANYMAAFSNSAFSPQMKEAAIEALGHDWGEPTYAWADDNSTVTATRACSRQTEAGCTETETVNTTFEGTEPTCIEAGQGTYTAAFKNAAFSRQTKEGTVKALGHDWSEPTYTWASDNSTVTASRVCTRQDGNSCTETETETASTTSEITRAATYTAKGQTTYTAAFENPAFKASKVETNIPMLAKMANTMTVKAAVKTVKTKKLKKKGPDRNAAEGDQRQGQSDLQTSRRQRQVQKSVETEHEDRQNQSQEKDQEREVPDQSERHGSRHN